MSRLRKLGPLWAKARTSVLTTAGFGSLTASAWTAWGTAAGLAAAGVSCLILEFLGGDDG